MWFEDIMLLALLASGVFLIGIPLYKLGRYLVPNKRNSLIQAKERLEQARLDAEAARLNKETEKLYNKMYEEALQDEGASQDEQQQEKHK